MNHYNEKDSQKEAGYETKTPRNTGMISLDYDWTSGTPVYNPKPRARIGLENEEEIKELRERLEEKTEKALKEIRIAKRASWVKARYIVLD